MKLHKIASKRVKNSLRHQKFLVGEMLAANYMGLASAYTLID